MKVQGKNRLNQVKHFDQVIPWDQHREHFGFHNIVDEDGEGEGAMNGVQVK